MCRDSFKIGGITAKIQRNRCRLHELIISILKTVFSLPYAVQLGELAHLFEDTLFIAQELNGNSVGKILDHEAPRNPDVRGTLAVFPEMFPWLPASLYTPKISSLFPTDSFFLLRPLQQRV